MDTPTTESPGTRQASHPAGANGTNGHLPRQPRHPATESGDKRLTRADVAALLGVSVPALRRLQGRAGVAGVTVASVTGGSRLLFTEADVAALRQASQARHPAGAATESGATCRDTRQASQARQPSQAPANPPADSADGWREALAQAQAVADTLRSERDVALVREQAALRRAEEAERGMGAANTRLEALRAAWWHWRVLLDALGPVARLRRRWPDAPAELTAERLLAAPAEYCPRLGARH
jgi:hypothetical protein